MLPAILKTTTTNLTDDLEAQQTQHFVKYSDMIRFFEIYPNVTYIFAGTMSREIHDAFLSRLQVVIEDKKMPTEDLCRAFNVLVRLSPYSTFT